MADCRARDGHASGIRVIDGGKGTFERCDVHSNSGAGFSIKGGPNIVDCRCFMAANVSLSIPPRASLLGGLLTLSSRPPPPLRSIRDGLGVGVHLYPAASGSLRRCSLSGNAGAGLVVDPGASTLVETNIIIEGRGGPLPTGGSAHLVRAMSRAAAAPVSSRMDSAREGEGGGRPAAGKGAGGGGEEQLRLPAAPLLQLPPRPPLPPAANHAAPLPADRGGASLAGTTMPTLGLGLGLGIGRGGEGPASSSKPPPVAGQLVLPSLSLGGPAGGGRKPPAAAGGAALEGAGPSEAPLLRLVGGLSEASRASDAGGGQARPRPTRRSTFSTSDSAGSGKAKGRVAAGGSSKGVVPDPAAAASASDALRQVLRHSASNVGDIIGWALRSAEEARRRQEGAAGAT